MKTYTRTFPIRIHDVDAAGIVFFARYLYLSHDVYEAFLEDIGHSIPKAIAEGEYIIPIKSCEAEYYRPMLHGETITAELFLTELRGSSFTIETRLIGPDKVLRATITTRHVCVGTAAMKPIALPDTLRAALVEYLHPGT
jgi:1,4-dihydroxy-2-naphthoyl-CoA hydrolase